MVSISNRRDLASFQLLCLFQHLHRSRPSYLSSAPHFGINSLLPCSGPLQRPIAKGPIGQRSLPIKGQGLHVASVRLWIDRLSIEK